MPCDNCPSQHFLHKRDLPLHGCVLELAQSKLSWCVPCHAQISCTPENWGAQKTSFTLFRRSVGSQ